MKCLIEEYKKHIVSNNKELFLIKHGNSNFVCDSYLVYGGSIVFYLVKSNYHFVNIVIVVRRFLKERYINNNIKHKAKKCTNYIKSEVIGDEDTAY